MRYVETPWWWEEAACIDAPRNIFFPKDNRELKTIRAAKAICRGCSVRADCFEYAIENESIGIFGGTTREERARIQALLRGRTKSVSIHAQQDTSPPLSESSIQEPVYTNIPKLVLRLEPSDPLSEPQDKVDQEPRIPALLITPIVLVEISA